MWILLLLIACGAEAPTAEDAEDVADDARTAAEKAGEGIGDTAHDVGSVFEDTVRDVVD